jgi:AraC-like DNA-binding protein
VPVIKEQYEQTQPKTYSISHSHECEVPSIVQAVISLAVPPLPYCLESGKTFHKPGDEHPNRTALGVFDFIAVESGTLYIGEEGRQWSLARGQSVLLLPDRSHYSVRPAEENTAFYWLHFHSPASWIVSDEAHAHRHADHARHRDEFLIAPYSLQIRQSWTLPYPEQAFRLMSKINEAASEKQSRAFWSRQQTFEELLRLLDLRQNEAYASPVIRVAESAEAYLKTHYRSPVTGDGLSKALSFHYNYITRCMKQAFGLTPMEYLMRYRLEQAKLLLLKTDWPIAAIAESVGFEHVPYFTSCFAKAHGLPPTKFRNSYRIPT